MWVTQATDGLPPSLTTDTLRYRTHTSIPITTNAAPEAELKPKGGSAEPSASAPRRALTALRAVAGSREYTMLGHVARQPFSLTSHTHTHAHTHTQYRHSAAATPHVPAERASTARVRYYGTPPALQRGSAWRTRQPCPPPPPTPPHPPPPSPAQPQQPQLRPQPPPAAAAGAAYRYEPSTMSLAAAEAL